MRTRNTKQDSRTERSNASVVRKELLHRREKIKQNLINPYQDNRRTCDTYECKNKLPNNSSSKLCTSCSFVSDLESRKPTPVKFDSVKEKITKIQDRMYTIYTKRMAMKSSS